MDATASAQGEEVRVVPVRGGVVPPVVRRRHESGDAVVREGAVEVHQPVAVREAEDERRRPVGAHDVQRACTGATICASASARPAARRAAWGSRRGTAGARARERVLRYVDYHCGVDERQEDAERQRARCRARRPPRAARPCATRARAS